MFTGGIRVTVTLKVGVKIGLWGTLFRHCNLASVTVKRVAPGTHLHRSEPFFTLNLREGPPLAPDTGVRTTRRVRGGDESEEKSQECVPH